MSTSVQHSPRRTRAQTPAAPPEQDALRAVLQELQQMREERRREREEGHEFRRRLDDALQQRDEAIQRLEQRLEQLSPLHNSAIHTGSVAECADVGTGARGSVDLGLRLRADVYDGTSPLREFLAQFSLVARANGWVGASKAVALASCLRGEARGILDADGTDSLEFEELKAKLELRFGEGGSAQSFYSRFSNRKQRPGEDLAAFGAELERLARLAYPECPHEVRDKIACSQFVAALSEGFVRRTLQVEGIASLRGAVERAKTLRVICESGDPFRRGERKGESHSSSNSIKGPVAKGSCGSKPQKKPSATSGPAGASKTCWGCGSEGHFRAQCPARQEN